MKITLDPKKLRPRNLTLTTAPLHYICLETLGLCVMEKMKISSGRVLWVEVKAESEPGQSLEV